MEVKQEYRTSLRFIRYRMIFNLFIVNRFIKKRTASIKNYLRSINLRFFDEIRKETKNEEMVRMQSNNHVSKTIKRSSIPTIITMNPQKVILMQLLS